MASFRETGAPTSLHRGPSALPKIRPSVSVVILRDASHGVDRTKENLATLVILYSVTASKTRSWR
jgi:hypothetical protein